MLHYLQWPAPPSYSTFLFSTFPLLLYFFIFTSIIKIIFSSLFSCTISNTEVHWMGILALQSIKLDTWIHPTVNFCVVDMLYVFLFQYLVDRVSGYIHAHTLYSAVRPFGCRWVAQCTCFVMVSFCILSFICNNLHLY